MFLLRWLLKITGIIPGLLAFNPRKIFTGALRFTWRYKAPAVIAMNHRGFLDYIEALVMFPFRRVDVLVSEAMYNYSWIHRTALKAMGVIKVSAATGNMSAVNEAIACLKKGHLVLVFPEGHIETGKELLEYKQSAALIAAGAGVPVIPVYHDGRVGVYRKGRAFIGGEMFAEDYCSSEDSLSEAAGKFTAAIYEITESFRQLYIRSFFGKGESRPKKPKYVNFAYKFVKYTGFPVLAFLTRPRTIAVGAGAEAALYSQKRMVMVCNHTWWIDNPLMYYTFRRRSPRSLAARDVAEKSVSLKVMQTVMGCIFLDRNSYDWKTIKTCLEHLNSEGCLTICPEGALNFDEKLKPFHPGAAMLALMTGSPIVPVYLNCPYKAFVRSYIFVGEPLAFEKTSDRDAIEAANKELEERMEELRRYAVSRTPEKVQKIITSQRAKNKARVQNFRN